MAEGGEKTSLLKEEEWLLKLMKKKKFMKKMEKKMEKKMMKMEKMEEMMRERSNWRRKELKREWLEEELKNEWLEEELKNELENMKRQEANELVRELKKGKEPRYDLRLIVMGHLRSGKTTTIKRLLKEVFDMESTESTNGIVVIKKGGIRLMDGKWLEKLVASSSTEEIFKRMKTIFSKDSEKLADSDDSSSSDEAPSNIKAEDDVAEIQRIVIDEDIICYLMIWDFAGQSVFNCCHQMFMSNKAMYLLVFDISKELDDEIEDDDVCRLGTQQKMSMKEFTEFLLSTIHMYHGQEKDAFPKVFLIGTHGDLVDKKVAEARMKTLKQEISKTPLLQRHIVGDFIVNNSDPEDTALERLKQAIFEKVQKELHWGEYRPTSWMPLEKEILSQRDNKGKRVLTLKEISDLNNDCYIQLETKEEIAAFLAFQNSLGNMMFFGGNSPDDIVILDPQWLIDSLKQIITHEQFYIRPEGLDLPWEEFTESAKLHIKLLEAVWANNRDKSFIKHKEKLLGILDSTDIVCMPKVYNTEGMSEQIDYLLVPSMLKANKDGIEILHAYRKTCKGKSSTLCFVFKDNFMPPAIFARVQAACIKEFRIKDKSDKNFVFHGASVFKLNRLYDLLLERCRHTIQVTVTSVQGKNINPQLCRSILTFFEETLREITHLYHNIVQESDLPYNKAIVCSLAEGEVDAWIPWEKLRESKAYHCQHHNLDKWHILETSDLLRDWSGENSSLTTEAVLPEAQRSMEGTLKNRCTYLNMQDLGRLGRSISHTDLYRIAHTVLTQAEIEQLKLDNRENAVDQNFAFLLKWNGKTKQGVSIEKITQALADAEKDVTSYSLKQALQNKDYNACFKDIPDDFLDSHLSDRSVDQICQRTGKEYKQLAIELCLSPVIIERVIIEKSKVIDRTRALVREWMFSHGATATYRVIGQAIVEVGMDISIIYDCYCTE